MKKYRWRYGVVSGLALVCMISGLKTDVLAAGKKTGRTGADIIAKAEGSMKAVESIKNHRGFDRLRRNGHSKRERNRREWNGFRGLGRGSGYRDPWERRRGRIDRGNGGE